MKVSLQIFKEWTSSVKKKAREIFVSRNLTGGGFPTHKFLTDIEEKLLNVFSKLIVEGMDVLELGIEENPKKIRARHTSHTVLSTKIKNISLKRTGYKSEYVSLNTHDLYNFRI